MYSNYKPLFFFIMYFSYLGGPPPHPCAGSLARWVGVRIHVMLLGIVNMYFMYCIYCYSSFRYLIINIEKRQDFLITHVVTMYGDKAKKVDYQKKHIVHIA